MERRITPLACFIIMAVLLGGCSLLPQEEADAVPTLIDPPESRTVTYEAQLGTITEEIHTTGRVAPFREATLYFTQDGRVYNVAVSLGDTVQEGDVLVQLDVTALEHQLALAKIEEKKFTLRLERLEFEVQYAPEKRLDLQLMKLDREKNLLHITQLNDEIEAATLRAPFDGVVTGLDVAVGETVQQYEGVITLADDSQLELHVELTAEEDFQRVAPGQKAVLETRQGEHVVATVTQVPTYTQRTATGPQRDRRVRLALDDLTALRMNETVPTVIVVREKHNALIVPNVALREFMGRQYVRVLEDGARREVDVQVGMRAATHIEILRGIEPGTVVIGR